jgi:putative ABC transport system permease protein
MSGSWNETADYPALLARVDRAIDAMGALPGVEGAATTGWALPGTPTQWESSFAVVEASADAARRIVTDLRVVSPEYFATMRIPLLQGERCERRPVGQRGAPSVQGFDVMVNRAFAARHLSDFPSAVGLHLKSYGEGALEAASKPGRIVGIVGDARERGIDLAPVPIAYSCLSAPTPTPFFLVRTSGDPLALVGAVRARMKELEPQRSVYEVAALDERIDGAYAMRRLLTLLLVAFSLCALSLACVGLYGTLSYATFSARASASSASPACWG